MDLLQAARERHTVRKFTDRPVDRPVLETLEAKVKEWNTLCGAEMTLVTASRDALGPLAKLIGKGGSNYLVLAAPEGSDVDEALGYYGAAFCLLAQTLGLNTWWIGGMFSLKGIEHDLGRSDLAVNSIIVFGYGAEQGKPHRSKRYEDVASYDGEAPVWFKQGVEMLLLAPTAINRQAYTVRGRGDRVSLSYKPGAFSAVDLGIGKYHFELGAGKENFTWEA